MPEPPVPTSVSRSITVRPDTPADPAVIGCIAAAVASGVVTAIEVSRAAGGRAR